jgi:methionyl-tRNA formyltransferase
MQQRIIFFGSGYYVIPIVEKLLKHNLLFVVTTEIEGDFVNYLSSNKIPFIQSKLKAPEDISKITELAPTLGILASYGAFIPQEVIDLFPLGIFNIHPSLLPRYKGPSPIQYTILNGEKEGGVTIIKLDDEIDHGPILAQNSALLDGSETLQSLTEKLFRVGSEMIEEIVQKIENGLIIEGKGQIHKDEVFTQKIKKSDGLIDLKSIPNTEDLDRKIRAFFPWPGIYLNVSLGGKTKILKLFPQGKVQVEGKLPMSYKDFINGYGKEADEILKQLSLA